MGNSSFSFRCFTGFDRLVGFWRAPPTKEGLSNFQFPRKEPPLHGKKEKVDFSVRRFTGDAALHEEKCKRYTLPIPCLLCRLLPNSSPPLPTPQKGAWGSLKCLKCFSVEERIFLAIRRTYVFSGKLTVHAAPDIKAPFFFLFPFFLRFLEEFSREEFSLQGKEETLFFPHEVTSFSPKKCCQTIENIVKIYVLEWENKQQSLVVACHFFPSDILRCLTKRDPPNRFDTYSRKFRRVEITV